ncbi:MAG: nucleoside deaminase [Silvibacterium sp.]|nr:nucleoside deaminase [Silvibacterium sp.]MBV8437520.1 nucleoside deaminase [Silvibacterium sp.]
MPSDPNPVFMQRAIQLAVENVRSRKGGPFAAVIVRDGEIVGEGANSVTSTKDPTAHAEVNAIRNACRALNSFTLKGCDIYTSCEPCPMCLAAIYWARIDAIYFGSDSNDAARAGFDDSYFYEEIRLHRDARSVPLRQILSDEAWQSFQLWIDTPEKTEY